jgi:hypothetical protein
MLALQGLNSGQLIGAQHSFTFLGQFRGLVIQVVDVFNLLVKSFVRDWREPIAYLMWFEISFFLRASPRVGARFGQQCHAL